jgi:hypothetical protein
MIRGLSRSSLCATAVVAALTIGEASTHATNNDAVKPRTISVVACNGEIQGSKYIYRGPRTTSVRLSASDAGRLVSFNGLLLAPKGWHCDLTGGSDGSTLVAYNPSAGFFSDIGAYKPREAVSAWFVTPGNHALFLACPFFPEAASQLHQQGLSCDSSFASTPTGESQTRIGTDEMKFVDPPGIDYGTGNPSGGPNTAVGFVLFDNVLYKGDQLATASTATCTVSKRYRGLCPAIIGNIRAQYQTELNKLRRG